MTTAQRPGRDPRELEAELDELRRKLAEAEETIDAIRSGAVDAFIIREPEGDRVYSLQTADRPYRILVESMQQGAMVLSAEGMVLYSNQRMAELLDAPHERLMGANLADYVIPRHRATLASLLAAAQSADARHELMLQRAAGNIVPVLLTLSRLPVGQSVSLCAIVTDITRERQHRELERSEAALRLSEELLRNADRRKDEFLATLAHELRNPLAPMRNVLEVLRLKGGANPDVEWAQSVIERQVRRLSRLVDDLLDLSQIATDRLRLSTEAVELADVIRQALETSLPSIEEQGHDLQIRLPPDPIVIAGDPGRLSQVFANLLVSVSAACYRFGRITLSAHAQDGFAVIEVADNGRGLAPEELPHVFDMFRGERAEGEGRGAGIALSLVHKLVVLHGGSISVHSDGAGKGCQFIIRLPLAGAGARPARQAPAEAAATRRNFRILVVDDSVDNADALAAMLRLMGNEVRTAYDGASALETGRAFEPQVVLLDVAMPGVDGHETCRRIRGEPWGDGAHVVAITGWGQVEDRRRTAEAGFDFHFVKPVDTTALGALLAGLPPRRAASNWPDLGRR